VACTVEGVNSYRSVIQMTEPGVPAISMTDGARLTLAGVGLTGTGVTDAASGVVLARSAAANTFGLIFDDVVIQQFGGDGIHGVEANVIVSSFKKVTCESLGGFGFNLTGVPGGAAGTSVDFASCYAVACAKSGFHLQKMNYSRLGACGVDSSGTGYVLEECEGIAFAGCGTEGVIAGAAGGMYADGTSFRVDDSSGVDFGYGCWTYGNSHLVLHVSGGSSGVRGVIAENSPTAGALGAVAVDSGCSYGL
jgi:hypothetical protein